MPHVPVSKRMNQRKKHFIDKAVQGTLLLRIVGHWVFFLFAAGALLVFVEMLIVEPREVWKNLIPRYGPTVLVVLVLTPIFIHDLSKLSNRFAGPIVSLRRAMRELAEGREVSAIHFRKNDFWKDLAVDFNRVNERVQALTTRAADAPMSPDSSNCDKSQDPSPTAPHSCEFDS